MRLKMRSQNFYHLLIFACVLGAVAVLHINEADAQGKITLAKKGQGTHQINLPVPKVTTPTKLHDAPRTGTPPAGVWVDKRAAGNPHGVAVHHAEPTAKSKSFSHQPISYNWSPTFTREYEQVQATSPSTTANYTRGSLAGREGLLDDGKAMFDLQRRKTHEYGSSAPTVWTDGKDFSSTGAKDKAARLDFPLTLGNARKQSLFTPQRVKNDFNWFGQKEQKRPPFSPPLQQEYPSRFPSALILREPQKDERKGPKEPQDLLFWHGELGMLKKPLTLSSVPESSRLSSCSWSISPQLQTDKKGTEEEKQGHRIELKNLIARGEEKSDRRMEPKGQGEVKKHRSPKKQRGRKGRQHSEMVWVPNSRNVKRLRKVAASLLSISTSTPLITMPDEAVAVATLSKSGVAIRHVKRVYAVEAPKTLGNSISQAAANAKLAPKRANMREAATANAEGRTSMESMGKPGNELQQLQQKGHRETTCVNGREKPEGARNAANVQVLEDVMLRNTGTTAQHAVNSRRGDAQVGDSSKQPFSPSSCTSESSSLEANDSFNRSKREGEETDLSIFHNQSAAELSNHHERENGEEKPFKETDRTRKSDIPERLRHGTSSSDILATDRILYLQIEQKLPWSWQQLLLSLPPIDQKLVPEFNRVFKRLRKKSKELMVVNKLSSALRHLLQEWLGKKKIKNSGSSDYDAILSHGVVIKARVLQENNEARAAVEVNGFLHVVGHSHNVFTAYGAWVSKDFVKKLRKRKEYERRQHQQELLLNQQEKEISSIVGEEYDALLPAHRKTRNTHRIDGATQIRRTHMRHAKQKKTKRRKQKKRSSAVFLVLPRARGDVEDYLDKKKYPVDVRYAAAEMLYGLHSLHRTGFLHRDVKLMNFFVSFSGHVMLADYDGIWPIGVPVPTKDFIIYTEGYLAPEVDFSKRFAIYTTKSDVYALGICFRELLTAQPETLDADLLTNLIDQMVAKNPEERLSTADAMLHEYFRDIKFQDLPLLRHPPPLPGNFLLTEEFYE